MNDSYSAKTKIFIFKIQSKENSSQKQFDKSDQNIDDLMRKFETLTLTINILSEKVA